MTQPRWQETGHCTQAADMQPLPPGDLSRLEEVGSGGFGVVYRVRSAKLGMDFALKNTLRDSDADLKSLKKEKEMMSRANHIYILRLLGLYETENRRVCKYGLVMEYMPYGSVYTLFHRIKDVPWALRFQIFHQVALGMNYLHHVLEPPIIHRDLKRQNVLLNKLLDVQLTDFGLAKNEESVSSSQSMAGTVSHMPPEALKFLTYKPTKEFDVYSYAILTWSILSGHEPYENVNAGMIEMLIPHNPHRPDMNLVNQWKLQKMVPEALQLMKECWDDDPGKRPSFSAIIKRTNEMNAAYADEIHNDIMKVLDQLKNHNSSHPQSLDILDCGKRSDPKSSIPDSSTFDLSNFRHRLQQEEKEGAEICNPSVTPETASQNIVCAVDFLRSHLPQIVQAKPDLNEVLDALFSNGTITEEERDIINNGSVQEQTRKTILMIRRKGQKSSMEFLQLMNRFHAELMKSL